jgi:septal ring factor EnvC (AmiA/AmiB activator)
MEEKNVIWRSREELKKVINEQSKSFKVLNDKLREKIHKISELQRENSILKYNIKRLERENKRLKHDKR